MQLAGYEAVGSGGDSGELEMHVLSKIGVYYSATADNAAWAHGLPCSLTYRGGVGMWIFMKNLLSFKCGLKI